MVAHEMRSANATTNQWELIPDSMEAASAMPARSAAILIVLAIKRAMTTASNSHLGNRCLRFPARPCPVTLPMRAHIICTAAISGHVRSAVQSSLVPSCAPATEYVAIPEGSSSAAPVMMPGPSDFSSVRIQRDGADVGKRKLGVAASLGSGHDSTQPFNRPDVGTVKKLEPAKSREAIDWDSRRLHFVALRKISCACLVRPVSKDNSAYVSASRGPPVS